jgi:hypothetical protein
MTARIRKHIRSNVVGYVAVFLALSLGTAQATHPGGANTISSGDIINQEVKNDDLGANAVGSGKIADGGVQTPDLADGAVGTNKLQKNAVTSAKIADGGVGLADLAAKSVDSTKVVNFSLRGFDLASDSINTPKVVNDSLFGVDIREDTLTPLDGHDAFTGRCDPGPSSSRNCIELSFFLQRSMPVIVHWNFAHWSDNDVGDVVSGHCDLKHNGNTLAFIPAGSNDAAVSFRPDAGIPVVDVMALGAGTHTLGMTCTQGPSADIVYGQMRIAAVELGMD